MGLLDEFDKAVAGQATGAPVQPSGGGLLSQFDQAATAAKPTSLLQEFDQAAARTIPRARSGPESIEAKDQSWLEAIGGNIISGTGTVYENQYKYGARQLAGSPLDISVGGTHLSEYMGVMGSAIEQWRKDHPEYSPAKADGIVELLTTPKALVGRTAGALSYMANMAGAAALPGIGAPAAFGMSYIAEGQSAYEDAIASGATKQQAEMAAEITGTVNGFIEMLQVGKIMKIGREAANRLGAEAIEKGLKKAIALGAGESIVKDIGIEAAQEMLQGAVEEGTAKFVYDKDYEGGWKGYVDRRLQEAVGAIALSGTTAVGGAVTGRMLGKPSTPEMEQLRQQANAFTDKDLEKIWREDFKLPIDAIGDASRESMAVATALVDTKARKLGISRAEAFAQMFAEPNSQELNNSVLFQSTDNVRGFYSKLESVLDGEKFQKSFGDKPAEASAVKAFLTKEGVKEEELEWTGFRGMLAEAEKAGVRISGKELQEYLAKHAVKIDTVIKGEGAAKELQEKRAAIQERTKEIHKQLDKLRSKQYVDLKPEEQEQLRQLKLEHTQLFTEDQRLSSQERLKNPRHQSYSARGPKTNYTEVLLRFPVRATFENTGPDTDVKKVGSQQEKVLFQNPAHWEEPNVIVHLRYDERWLRSNPEEFQRQQHAMNEYMAGRMTAEAYDKFSEESFERYGRDDEKILFVNEIQSDWHQEGRKKGYKNEALEKEVKDLEADYERLKEEELRFRYDPIDEIDVTNEAPEKIFDKYQYNKDQYGNLSRAYDRADIVTRGDKKLLRRFKDRKRSAEEHQQADFPSRLTEASNNVRQAKERLSYRIEQGPFQKTWVDLALKKVMLDAVEKGFDRVAFASGEIQAEIYGALSEEQKQGQEEFYDKILPNKVKDLLKKLDPQVKLEVVKLPKGPSEIRVTPEERANAQISIDEENGRYQVYVRFGDAAWSHDSTHDTQQEAVARGDEIKKPEQEVPEYQSVLSFKLTDKIRQKLIDEGLPLFQSRQNQPSTPQVFNDIGSYLQQFNPEAAEKLKRGEMEPAELARYSRDMASERANYMSAPLFQTNKASTRFLQDGRAIISALKNPDVSSAIHELAHVARRHVLDGEDLATVEQWAGVKQGVWAVEHEERFAKAFEKYIREGKAPSSTLVTAFQKLKQWMRQIYKKIADLGLDTDINDDIRGVFDRMLAEDTKPVEAQRQLIKQLKEEKKQYKNKDDPSDMLERARLADEIVAAEKHLEDLQRSSYQPGVPSPAEQRWAEAEALPPISDPDNFKEIRGLRWWPAAFQNFFASMGSKLENYEDGRRTMRLLDNATETRKSLTGELDLEFKQLMDDMGVFQSEAVELGKPDADGFSGLQKLIEESGIPEDKQEQPKNERQVKIKKFVKRVQDFLTSKAIEEAIQRRMPSGDLATIRRSMKERLPRMLMEDAWRAIEKQNGPLYNAIVKAAKDNNPELKTFEQAHRAIQAQYGKEALKKVGVLEKSRAIKIMPDHVFVHGRPVGIFHSGLYNVLDHLIDQQAMRVAFIKEFGQGLMKNYRSRWDPKTNEWVGNRGPLKLLFRVLGQEVTNYDKITLINKLLDKGVTPTGGESMSKLRAIAKDYDVPIGPDYMELLGRMMMLHEGHVDKRRIPKLRAFAKQLKGIDSKLPVPELLNSIKQRLSTDVEDNLLNRLRDRYGRQGGDVEDFDAVMKVWQGLPYGWLPRNPATRAFRFYGDVLGTAHTSLSTLRNIGQTGTQVPQMAGIQNFLAALGDVLKDYNSARDAAVSVGAMRPVMYNWRSETGYGLETLGRNLRQLTGKITGMRWIAELNETIAATAGKRLAEDWKNNGFTKADVGVAKNLRLNDQEIESLLRREPMSERTYRKIIQTMVAETQYTTQAGHRRAMAENIPLLKSLFSYQSYTYGATRNALELVKEGKEAVRSGDPNRMAAVAVRASTLVAASYGVGVLGKMLVGLIKGQPPRKEDEGWWDTVLGSAVETQLLGIGSKLINPFEYANGSTDKWILGFMPQIRSLGSLIELMINGATKAGLSDAPIGKYGRFPMGKQVWEQVKNNTPILKAFSNWTENYVYPDRQEYQKTRNLVGEYEKALAPGTRSSFSNEPMNPDYYEVFESIARNDPDAAVAAAKSYYRTQKEKGVPSGVARRSLRQSLMSRRPIALSPQNGGRFLRGLPLDRKLQVIETQKRYTRLMNRVAPSLD